jgi:catalase
MILPNILAKIFSEVGKKTEMFARFSTVAGERGAPMQNVIFEVLP